MTIVIPKELVIHLGNDSSPDVFPRYVYEELAGMTEEQMLAKVEGWYRRTELDLLIVEGRAGAQHNGVGRIKVRKQREKIMATRKALRDLRRHVERQIAAQATPTEAESA